MTSPMLDFGLLALLAVFAFLGMRRGFVRGTLDLTCWLVSLLVTLLAASPATTLLDRWLPLPKGLLSFLVAWAWLFVTLSLATLVTNKLYRAAIAPHLRQPLTWVDRALGAFPGAINGLIVAGLLLEFVLLLPWSSALTDAIMSARLARPIALAALAVGQPFVNLAEDAALDVNGFLTKRFGDAPMRLTLPVTDLSTDAAAEKRMLELVNAERTQRSLPPLTLDARLTAVARQHSEEMLQQHYFAHDSPKLGSPFDRMARAGIRYRAAGENIALAPNVERAHVGLMNSPEHRENILRPEFHKVGIGIVNGGLSGEMFTQDFTD